MINKNAWFVLFNVLLLLTFNYPLLLAQRTQIIYLSPPNNAMEMKMMIAHSLN